MNRIKYIDILRGWAVLLMVFWHLDEALISNSIRETTLFDISQFIGGIVAPLFLFSSGASHAILILKKRESFIKITPVLGKRIIRILQILAVAYLLHLPEGDFWNIIISRSGEAYKSFINMDVLQLIAVSLLLLQFLFLLIKNNRVYLYVTISAGLAVLISTPFIWQINFSDFLPIELAAIFNNATGSLFPLFPWLAYVFMGSAILQLLLENPDRQPKLLIWFFSAGVFMVLAGLIPELLKIETSPYYDFWRTSPNIFFIKFGIVLILLFVFSELSKRFNYQMKIFSVFGQESLFIYVAHLLMIYGTGFYTLQTNMGRSLNWLELFAVYFLMIVLLLFMGKGWSRLKKYFREKKLSKA